jgi:two-component system, cell cycle sensor histidine kinase PleC
MPTLAPAVVAPPMIYVLIRAVDLLGRAENRLQAHRERLQEAVKLARDQARKAEIAARAKSDFLAHMSHELRTPLNAILGFSETIRDTRLGPIGTESYREYAGYIHESGAHLLSLINDILDMSRIEAGQMELRVERHQAIDLVRESLAMIEGEANSKKITLDISGVAPDLTVRGDRRAIKQVLINLLSNAVKFTPTGGRVEVLGEMIGNEATELTVTDTGIGIPEESLEQIFEAFVMLGQAEAGTGLGLPLAKGLVDLHGGSLTIDSTPGAGTKAHVKFPLAPA